MRIDPMAADGLVNRGNTLKEIGRVNDAIQDYIRAVTIRPTMAEGHANLASAYKDRLSLKLESIRLVICIWLFLYTFCMLWVSSASLQGVGFIQKVNEILLSESLWSSCQLASVSTYGCVHILRRQVQKLF
jgi:tetratricopeptide (TPR) repeat protein